MSHGTKRPKPEVRRHLSIVREDGPAAPIDGSWRVPGSDEWIHTQCYGLCTHLEEYFDEESTEDLYIESYNLVRQIFMNSTTDWSEAALTSMKMSAHWYSPVMYHEAQHAGSERSDYLVRGDDGTQSLDDEMVEGAIGIAQNMSMATRLSIDGQDQDMVVPDRVLNCLVYLGVQGRNVARNMYIVMSEYTDRARRGVNDDEPMDLELVLSKFESTKSNEEAVYAMGQFIIGYSRIVAEGAARGFGYDSAIARYLSEVIALDALGSIPLADFSANELGRMDHDWVAATMEEAHDSTARSRDRAAGSRDAEISAVLGDIAAWTSETLDRA